MEVVLILFAVVVLIVSLIWGFKSMGDKPKNNTSLKIPEISKVTSIKELVMCLNHGRVYPFYTRMNLERAKTIVMQSGLEKVAFNNSLHLQELIGRVYGVHIPLLPNALVNDVYLSFNRNRVISSITIDVANLDFTTLVEQMLLKFGNPVSVNSQLMVWRDTCMTISLDSIEKYINVMDERLPS